MPPGNQQKMLHILVSGQYCVMTEDDKEKLNLTLPLGMSKMYADHSWYMHCHTGLY